VAVLVLPSAVVPVLAAVPSDDVAVFVVLVTNDVAAFVVSLTVDVAVFVVLSTSDVVVVVTAPTAVPTVSPTVCTTGVEDESTRPSTAPIEPSTPVGSLVVVGATWSVMPVKSRGSRATTSCVVAIGLKVAAAGPATPPELTAGSELTGPVSKSRSGCAQSPGAASAPVSAEAAQAAMQITRNNPARHPDSVDRAPALLIIVPSRV
jgi:hypothetical protein